MTAATRGASARSPWVRRVAIVAGTIVAIIVVLVAAIFVITNARMDAVYDVQPTPLAVKPSQELAGEGKAVATYRGCRDCHGEDLAGRVVGDAMPVMRLAAPNITPGGVTKDYTDEDWARAIRHGVRPSGTPIRFMPVYEYIELSHEDLAAIIAYARSVPAVSEVAAPFEVGPLGRVLYLAGELPLLPAETLDHDLKPANPTPGPTREYGRYLASGCVGCHGHGLSGGKIPGVPPDWPAAPNLTSHESGLAQWTFEDFKNTIRTGTNPTGQALTPEYMPWKLIAQSSDDDLRALWEYLRSVPPKPAGNR